MPRVYGMNLVPEINVNLVEGLWLQSAEHGSVIHQNVESAELGDHIFYHF